MWERGIEKNPSGNYCTQRTSREVSLVFSSHFQKPPACSEFSGVHLEIHQSNLFFQTAELFLSGNQTSLPHLYLCTQKIRTHFQKWIPLCLLKPNDCTDQFVGVLDTFTTSSQCKLRDSGGLGLQLPKAHQLLPRSGEQQPCICKRTTYVF